MSDREALLPAMVEDADAPPRVVGIAGRLASSISLGLYVPGERLPTEVDLARQFGVAVATLRKALATLRERGIVETRRGRSGGTFVVAAPFPTDDEVLAALAETSVVDLRDLGDEAVAIGSAVARLAASRAPYSSADGLVEIAGRLVAARTAQERAVADGRFHVELAVLAQSPRLLRAELRVQSEITPLFWSGPVTDDAAAGRAHAEHLRVVDAVRDADPRGAERLMAEHVHRCAYHLIDAKMALGRQVGSDRRPGGEGRTA